MALPEHVVRDGLVKVRFTGDQLAAVSTETSRQPRWIELELYSVEQAPAGYEGAYYLHIVGRSVVFHVHDSPTCNTGIPTPVEKVPLDGEPCPRCRPDVRLIRVPGSADPDDLMWVAAGGIDTVDLESDRHTLHPCASAGEVFRQLISKTGPAKGKLSAPAQRLLEIAAMADPAVEEAIDVTETY